MLFLSSENVWQNTRKYKIGLAKYNNGALQEGHTFYVILTKSTGEHTVTALHLEMHAYKLNLQPESQEKFSTDQLKASRSKEKKNPSQAIFLHWTNLPFFHKVFIFNFNRSLYTLKSLYNIILLFNIQLSL